MNKIAVFSVLSMWAFKALADGKITLSEVLELAEQVAAILNVKLEMDVPGMQPVAGDGEGQAKNPYTFGGATWEYKESKE